MTVGRRSGMRTAATLLALPVIVAVGVVVLNRPGPAAAVAPAAPLATQVDAEAVYQRECAFCHGDDGAGTARGPAVDDDGPALIDYMLSTGRMPIDSPDDELDRGEPSYPPEVVALLVDYVADLGGPGGEPIPDVDAARGDVALGGDVFRLQCAPCHQWAADGGGMLYGPAPGLRPSTPVQIGEAVRTGPGTMPAFGEGAIPDHELDSLAAYIDYLDDPRDRGGWGLGHLGPLGEGFIAWTLGMGVLLMVTHRIGEQR